MATRKYSHTELTLKHRVKLIKAADLKPKPTQEELAKRFGIGRIVSNILGSVLLTCRVGRTINHENDDGFQEKQN